MPRPLLIFRVGYMKAYDGVGEITGGGAYVEEHGEGGEMWNFRIEGGRCYGYVMTLNFSGIDLSRLDSDIAWKPNDELDGVDIVFIAKKPSAGQVIVGWYKGATVYHKQYRKRRGSRKLGDWEKLDYLCEVHGENAVLLDEADRTFEVPYAPVHGKGYPGNSNVWYADSKNDTVNKFLARVHKYISSKEKTAHKPVKGKAQNTSKRSQPPDKELITRIEQAAIDAVWRYYKKQGYELASVERDNRGWDLEATRRSEILRLEVKGHIGNVIQFELTPNEYAMLKQFATKYRVCIVRQALKTADLEVFAPKKKKGIWHLMSSTGNGEVALLEKVAARAYEVN